MPLPQQMRPFKGGGYIPERGPEQDPEGTPWTWIRQGKGLWEGHIAGPFTGLPHGPP